MPKLAPIMAEPRDGESNCAGQAPSPQNCCPLLSSHPILAAWGPGVWLLGSSSLFGGFTVAVVVEGGQGGWQDAQHSALCAAQSVRVQPQVQHTVAVHALGRGPSAAPLSILQPVPADDCSLAVKSSMAAESAPHPLPYRMRCWPARPKPW